MILRTLSRALPRADGLVRPARSYVLSKRLFASSPGSEQHDVHDASDLPLSTLALQASSPNQFAVKALDGHKFAWFRPAGPLSKQKSLLIADPATIQSWFNREWELGSVTGWPETISKLLGSEAMAVTRSAEQHQQLRKIFAPMLSDEQMGRMLPNIQTAAQKYMREWAAKGTVPSYTETLTLVFDVLVNQAMQLGWSDGDTRHYAQLFEVWNQGFTPILNPLPHSAFSKGMKARVELVARFRKSLQDPSLQPGSIPAALRDAYGADSDVCTDNLIMVIFAGFETTTSAVVGLLYHLAKQPAALEKLREEHRAVAAKHGATLSLASLKDMRYTEAAVSETLRLAQIVASVPRYTVKPIEEPEAPHIPKGCPFSAAWGGMSVLDPAVKGDVQAFRPERWLDPANEATLKAYQRPFGYGQHSCLGFRVARATAVAVAQELATSYNMTADTATEFSDFPTGGRPKNELPLSLKPL